MEEPRRYPPMLEGARYNPIGIPLSLKESLKRLWRTGVWERVEKGFSDPILPGEPGYEDAIYEPCTLRDRRALRHDASLRPDA